MLGVWVAIPLPPASKGRAVSDNLEARVLLVEQSIKRIEDQDFSSRFARLEADVRHSQEGINRIENGQTRTNERIESLIASMSAQFRWVIGLLLTSLLGLAGFIVSGLGG